MFGLNKNSTKFPEAIQQSKILLRNTLVYKKLAPMCSTRAVAVLRGVQGGHGPALWVTQKGPRTQQKIEKKSQENI